MSDMDVRGRVWRMSAALAAWSWSFAGGAAWGQVSAAGAAVEPVAPVRVTVPVRPAEEPAAEAPDEASALLKRLETAGADIRTLSADVRYDRRFKLQGDQHVRQGRLYFASEPAAAGGRAARSFGIHFDTLFVSGRKQDDPQVWVFDGRWLVEKRPAQKRFTKREVAREGESFDPLRIGEGPMPLPIGQKAEEILARYAAERLAPEDGLTEEQRAGLPFVSSTVQLRLTPRAASGGGRGKRDEFREIRLWYDAESLLPRLARTVSRSGDESFVVLLNLRANEPGGLPAGAIDPSEPRSGAGWDVQVVTLDEAEGAAEER